MTTFCTLVAALRICANVAVEALARERVDGERRVHAVLEPADVGLGDVGVDLHLAQVLGDREERPAPGSEAATVWPTSTLREMTMPSIGEMIVV